MTETTPYTSSIFSAFATTDEQRAAFDEVQREINREPEGIRPTEINGYPITGGFAVLLRAPRPRLLSTLMRIRGHRLTERLSWTSG